MNKSRCPVYALQATLFRSHEQGYEEADGSIFPVAADAAHCFREVRQFPAPARPPAV